MKITKNTPSYNHRRMGKPWIALVDFSSPKGEFKFGDWTGDQYNGGEGVLSIDATPGQIMAIGQKDNRQPKNSAPDFYLVAETGALSLIGDKGAAYRYYLDALKSVPIPAADTHTALLAERERLTNRIAEINAILNP